MRFARQESPNVCCSINILLRTTADAQLLADRYQRPR
jgi:hypothetical protein